MELFLVVLSGAVSCLGALFMHTLKQISTRLRYLEESYLSKKEVRQLVDDKIGGIHSDLRDIKAKIDKLFDLYIDNRLNRRNNDPD